MSTPTKPKSFGGKAMRSLCPICMRERPPIVILSTGCDTCTAERQRDADKAAFEAKKPPLVEGVMIRGPSDQEIENIRDNLLDRTNWTQLADRRAKIGNSKAKQWDEYRQAVDQEARDARDQKRPPSWPPLPT